MIPEPYSIILILIGVAIGFISAPKYIYEMLKGRVKPNKITWLIWGIAPLIGGYAMIHNGFSWHAIPVLTAGAWPLIIFLFACFTPQAYWKLKPFDYSCGILSVLAIILWVITDIPLIAVILTVAADALAGIPTVTKTWKFPETENFWPYATAWYSQTIALLSLTIWTPLEYLFPLYLWIFCTTMMYLCLRKSETFVKK